MLEGPSNLLSRPEVLLAFVALGGFLAIYAVLRGSLPGTRPGPEDESQAPPPVHRERSLLLLAIGLGLVLAGALLAPTYGIPWSIPPFLAGVGLVAWQNQANRPYRHSSPVLRRATDLSHLFLNTALLAGILVVANVAAFRYGGRGIDLTRERTFSLSSRTLNQLEHLRRPVTFHIIYGAGPRAARQLDRVVQLLELYRGVSPGMIRVDSLNPWTELARGEDLMKRAPDLALLRGGGVLIEYGEGAASEFAVVGNQEMFETASADLASSGPDRFSSSFKGEDAITAALIRLHEGKRSKVAFLVGHGEPSASDAAPNSPGIGLWRARLASVGCEPIELNLISDAIPDDLALLIIAGPRSPLKPEELAKLRAYADRGGPVLVLTGNAEPTGLEEFLRSFNLELDRGLVIDPQLNFNRNPQLVFAMLRGAQGHPITASLPPDRAILVPNGAPIRVLGLGPAAAGKAVAPPVDPNLVPVPFLRTGQRSWAETDLTNPRPTFDAAADLPGPVVVGVAVQQRGAPIPAGDPTAGGEPKPRLVLLSSRSLADNLVQGIEPTNLDLLMNAASWLRGRPDAVGIAANTHVALTLSADPLLRSRLVVVPTVMSMLATLCAGVLVYLARRE